MANYASKKFKRALAKGIKLETYVPEDDDNSHLPIRMEHANTIADLIGKNLFSR